MSQIKLEKMSFYAHHGYYTHEQKRGGNYLVDVSLHTNFDQAAIDDDLEETINYEVIYRICADIMNEPVKLIETVAYQIAHEIKKAFPAVEDIEVTVHKIAPELGGPVGSATVTYTLK
jgi:dihydroneopterin aldolase